MGLTGKTPLEIAKRIVRRSFSTDVASSDNLLCIYFRPSRRTRSEHFHEQVLQVDCHVPVLEEHVCRQVIARVKTLLHRHWLNNRVLYFDGQLGELPSMAGFVCTGARFTYHLRV